MNGNRYPTRSSLKCQVSQQLNYENNEIILERDPKLYMTAYVNLIRKKLELSPDREHDLGVNSGTFQNSKNVIPTKGEPQAIDVPSRSQSHTPAVVLYSRDLRYNKLKNTEGDFPENNNSSVINIRSRSPLKYSSKEPNDFVIHREQIRFNYGGSKRSAGKAVISNNRIGDSNENACLAFPNAEIRNIDGKQVFVNKTNTLHDDKFVRPFIESRKQVGASSNGVPVFDVKVLIKKLEDEHTKIVNKMLNKKSKRKINNLPSDHRAPSRRTAAPSKEKITPTQASRADLNLNKDIKNSSVNVLKDSRGHENLLHIKRPAPSPVHRLRERKKIIAYKESPCSSPAEAAASSAPSKPHVPVYEKHSSDLKKTSNTDEYEFDSDSEKKSKSRKGSDDSFRVSPVRKKPKIQRASKKNEKLKGVNSVSYETKMGNIMSKFVNKINVKKKRISEEDIREIVLDNNSIEIVGHGRETTRPQSTALKIYPTLSETEASKSTDSEIELTKKSSRADANLRSGSSSQASATDVQSVIDLTDRDKSSSIIEAFDENTCDSQEDLPESTEASFSPFRTNPETQTPYSYSSSSVNETDDSTISPLPAEASAILKKKIDSKGNVLCNKSENCIRSARKFSLCNPRGARTITNRPWRFNEPCVKLNPHFIKLKNSALPSLNQELVLDHRFDTNLRVDSMEKVNEVAEPRPAKQTTLETFITSIPPDPSQELTRYSLFDAENLSPIKQSTPLRKPSKENVKRRPLIEIIQNVTIDTQTIKPDCYIETTGTQTENTRYFGFGNSKSASIESIENVREKDEFPFRLVLNSSKYAKKRGREDNVKNNNHESEKCDNVVVSAIDADKVNKVTSKKETVQNDCNDNQVSTEPCVGLFEETVRDNLPRSYQACSRTKKKAYHDSGTSPIRKPKVVTKTASEMKAERKWIKEFNMMCNEVESFELEVE